MSFVIEERKGTTGQAILQLRNQTSNEFAEIFPNLGGTVRSIVLNNGNALQSILKGDTDEEIESNPKYRGRLLFPFNDRIPKGEYSFDGKTYRLNPNSKKDGSAIHGLIHNRTLSVFSKETTDDFAKLVLYTKIENEKGYPFQLELFVHYVLKAGTFRLEFHVHNLDKKKVPVALGWHPYFQLGAPTDSLKLKCASTGYVEVDNALIPTRKIPECHGSNFDFCNTVPIGKRELDIALKVPTDGVTTLVNGKSTLILRQDPKNMHFMQIYIPPDRSSIALEPVTAATNSFNFPELGLHILNPKESFTTWAEVELCSQAPSISQ